MTLIKYLRYIVEHKWFVFVECCRLGVPLLGLVHDLSKFLPGEWTPYALSFYGPWKYKERPRWLKLAFDLAWNRHQKVNKHHWQAWVLLEDDGGIIPLPMPDKYRRELLADWKGAGRAVGKPDTKAWYLEQRAKGRQVFHPDTRTWIEEMLGVLT